MNRIVIVIALFLAGETYCQQKMPLSVNLAPIPGSSAYRINIYNRSDSIICLITSCAQDASQYRLDSIITLVPTKRDSNNVFYYKLKITKENLQLDYEGECGSGLAILPLQSKIIDFTIYPEFKQEKSCLALEYIVLANYDHNKFKTTAKGSWFQNYVLKTIRIEVPHPENN